MFDFDVRAGQDLPEPGMLATLSQVRALREELSEPVVRLARRSPVVVTPATTVREAVDRMTKQRACAGLVVSHDVFLGTLSESEIVRRLLADPPVTTESPVWKVMVSEPETLLENDTVAHAVQRLWILGGGAMPVMRANGTLAGLLDTQDIVAWLCTRMSAKATSQAGHG